MKFGFPLLALAAALSVACAQGEPIRDSPAEAGQEGGSDAGLEASVDAAAEAGKDGAVDAPSEAGAAGCQCDDPACGSCPTVTQIAAGGYGIDATEVTNADYGAFLGTNPKTSVQPAECSGNIGFAPNSGWPAAVDKQLHPVVDVDWCDARAYCFWAKKRLCGRIGGGENPYGDFTDATKSQWHNACSGGGSRAFPYGATYTAAICNGSDFGTGNTVPVSSNTGCVGGYPGLFDMSGNVWEWEASCNAQAGSSDLCRIRGGSYSQNAASLDCAADSALPRGSAGKAVGFRCCG